MYQIKNERLTIGVATLGAELQSAAMDGTEYLWNGDSAYWAKRSPLLFPFVGRFFSGCYRYHGTTYKMNTHGFAREMEFQVLEATGESILLALRDTPETLTQYPFHFSLRVKYTVRGNVLEIVYEVENTSDDILYFGIGGHPGFRVPLEDGLDFQNYYLAFSQSHTPSRVGHSPSLLRNGMDVPYQLQDGYKLPLNHELFQDDAVILQDVDRTVSLRTDQGKRGVTVRFPSMPYLGIWHVPNQPAPYVCIEPFASLPSRDGIAEDFACKSDLIRLEQGETYQNCWSIEFH